MLVEKRSGLWEADGLNMPCSELEGSATPSSLRQMLATKRAAASLMSGRRPLAAAHSMNNWVAGNR